MDLHNNNIFTLRGELLRNYNNTYLYILSMYPYEYIIMFAYFYYSTKTASDNGNSK